MIMWTKSGPNQTINPTGNSVSANSYTCGPAGYLYVRPLRSGDDLTSLYQLGTAPPIREVFMNWFILVVAGFFEIGWAVGLKYTDGFTRLWPTVGTVLSMIISLGLLGIAMKSLPVGTAYAVWVGVGAVGTAILGVVLLGESANPMRLLSLSLIVAGIVGLKLATPA
jgi:quaternary ammonium compound-resistance protein SugE